MKDLDQFHAFLESSGAALLSPTNKYEITRFKVNGVTSIIYENKRGRMTFVGDAGTAYEKFKRGIEWRPQKKKRTPVSKKKNILAERDGLKCFYCQKTFIDINDPDITIEHLLNVSHGGNGNNHNLALACKQCNLVAGDKSIVEKILIRDSYKGGL